MPTRFNKIPVIYPDGLDARPVCFSADVVAEYGFRDRAMEYMRFSSKERRHGLAGSRSERSAHEPLHLYKYRPLNARDQASVSRAHSILVQDRIWAASPASLNDPKDMRFKLIFNQDNGTRMKWAKENAHLLPKLPPARRLLRQQQLARASMTPEMEAGFKQDLELGMGVFCASTDPRSQLMWTHYAAEHRGICIQFAPYEDEFFLMAKKVIYSKRFPILVVPAPAEDRQEYYLYKSPDWSYEKEWRVVLPLNTCFVALRPSTISAVILGARAEHDTIEAVIALLQERERAGKPPLRLYQAQLNDESFDISIRLSTRSVRVPMKAGIRTGESFRQSSSRP